MTDASRPAAARLSAIVPAAGRSRRMGREKVLLPFAGSTFLETILAMLLRAGVPDVAVVLRPDLSEARERAERAGARVLVNPDPDGEMMESIRIGVRALPPDDDAFFVWPADHPAVAFETVTALAAAARRDTIVIPTWRARRGHPALVGGSLRDSLLALPPGVGLRELWRERADAVREIPTDDPGIVANLDTPEDYAEARKRSRSGS